jgi:phytoene dehydrogenase-like protein
MSKIGALPQPEDRDTSLKSEKAIVIGGGPAGLIAAGDLAEGGIATTLLEAAGEFGGRAATERRQGFDLNQGPHALYVGGPTMGALKSREIDLARWNPASHRSVFLRGGRSRRLPGGTRSLAAWLVGVARGSRPADLAGLSVSEWLGQTVGSDEARQAAAALVRLGTFVADHDALSADVAATQLKILLTPGVRYLRGGWRSLTDALASRARDEGAILRSRAGVRDLRRRGDGWSVTLDEETLHADIVVVATGGPEMAARLLGEEAPAAPGPPAEVSVLDLGLRSLPREGRRFALGIDQPTYLSRHSPPRHPHGVHLSLASYGREPRSALEAVADAVQPGWRGRVMFERFLPRMVAVSAVPSPSSGGLPGRPDVECGGGIYLAGDWLGPEGWLVDAAISSGAAAARAALRRRAPVAA